MRGADLTPTCLVNLAQRKGVQISCVLCTSREQERAVYEQVLDKTRKFMNSLATGTGGLMLDLSYPDIRSALVEAAKKGRVERQRIGPITRGEVEAVRQAAAAAKLPVADGQRLRVAVLPHLPLDQMSFDPTQDAVQIATELRQKFKAIPRAEVASPVDVERALRRVKSANVAPDQQLQAIAVQLRVDYLVWGSFRKAQGVVQVRSAIYRKTDGQKVTESQALTSAMLPENQLAGDLVSKWTLAALDPKSAPVLYAAFAGLRDNNTLKAQVLTPVANTVETRTDLLTGFEALEQALAYPIGRCCGHDPSATGRAGAVDKPPARTCGIRLFRCCWRVATSISRKRRRKREIPTRRKRSRNSSRRHSNALIANENRLKSSW